MKPLLPPGASYQHRQTESIASRKRAPFMTLIVAVKSKDSVILAADSQVSYDYSSLRTDIPKIERVDFLRFPALVALAENVANAQRFVAILREMAHDADPQTADETGAIVQAAMRALRNEVAANLGANGGELDKLLREQTQNCSMTVAFRINREPHIVKTNLLEVRYEKSRAKYEADGCGATLADYILKEYFIPDADFENAALIAAYAAWTVTQHDRYCRGPIVMAAVCPFAGVSSGPPPPSRVVEFTHERVQGLLALIEQADTAAKEARRGAVTAAFAAREAAFHQWLEAEIANLPEPTDAELQDMVDDRALEEADPRLLNPDEDEGDPKGS